MVPVERIELPTFGLQNHCSTAELNRRNFSYNAGFSIHMCAATLAVVKNKIIEWIVFSIVHSLSQSTKGWSIQDACLDQPLGGLGI